MSGHNGPGMPGWVYDDAVRVLVKCPDVPQHAHIAIESLRRMADDLAGDGVFRKAVELAYAEGRAEGWEDGVSQGRASGYDEGHEAGRESGLWAATHAGE